MHIIAAFAVQPFENDINHKWHQNGTTDISCVNS